MMNLEGYSQMLSALYAGYQDTLPWSKFLEQLRDVMELRCAYLILRPPTENDGGLMFTSGYSKHIGPDNPSSGYTDSYYTLDPMLGLPLERVVTLDELISAEKLTTNRFYQLCLKPRGIRYIAGIDLPYDNGQHFSIRLSRGKAQGAFSATELNFVRLLATHIKMAINWSNNLINLNTERKVYERSLSARSIGLLLLDESGRIIKTNPNAQRILSEQDGLSVSRESLHLNDPKAAKTIKTYIGEAMEEHHCTVRPSVRAVAVPRPSGKQDYELVIKALSVDHWKLTRGSPRLILYINDPEATREVSLRLLMDFYRLTPSEANLAIVLSEGKQIEEVASDLNISRNTVRAHLRSIFAKTGVSQQSMLVSLVLSSLAHTV